MIKRNKDPFQKWLGLLFVLLFLFTPLILTPWNFELFEFNKMIFVYLVAVLVLGTWVARMVTHRCFIFRRTFWDIPLVIFFITQLSGTIFSLHPHTSFWGYYTRGHGGLASSIAYLILSCKNNSPFRYFGRRVWHSRAFWY